MSLQDIRSGLVLLRDKHHAETPIGRRCSNIIELIDQLPRPPEDWIDYLLPDCVREQWAQGTASLDQQSADLRRLLKTSHGAQA